MASYHLAVKVEDAPNLVAVMKHGAGCLAVDVLFLCPFASPPPGSPEGGWAVKSVWRTGRWRCEPEGPQGSMTGGLGREAGFQHRRRPV